MSSASSKILSGVRPLDVKKALADASHDQVKNLMRESFALWAQFSNISVDGHQFSFDDHRYLLPIYLDGTADITWMKSAQMGATVYMLLRLLWFTRHHQANAGLYFPTADGVTNLSKARLGPILDSCEDLRNSVKNTEDTLGLKAVQNIHGNLSHLYMLYLGGTATKDSVPLDIVGYDEVRLVDPKDIDQALERIGHSRYKYKMFMSTAGIPGCFDGATTIVTRRKSDGAVLPTRIDALVANYKDYQVLSYNKIGGKRTRWRDIKGAVCHGVKPVVSVTLWGGNKIRCTPDHQFMQALPGARKGNISLVGTPICAVPRYPKAFGGDGPKHGVLCVNDYLVKPNAQWGVKSEQFSPYDLLTCKVVGLFIAEGTVAKTEIAIWQTGGAAKIPYVRDWITQQGLPFRENEEGIFIGAGQRPDLLKLFNDCGHLAVNKKIPDQLMASSPAQLRSLIDGIVDGDAHKRAGPDGNFDIYTSSPVLAEQLRFVCLRVGLPTSTSVNRGEKGVMILGRGPYDTRDNYCVATGKSKLRLKEVLPELGKVAVRSVENDGEGLVYDIQVDGDPWFVLADSGCLVHNSDIHARFLRGKQFYWVVKCACRTGEPFIPSECFPDCIVEHKGEVYLRCPRCKMRIHDAQNGNYVAMNPTAEHNSYHISQLVGNPKFTNLKEIWQFYQTTTNKKEFFNAKLGKPYIDEASRPVSLDTLENCINPNLRWSTSPGAPKELFSKCAMGVDAMGDAAYVVIARRDKDGKKQIVHYEIIESENPIYWQAGKPVSIFKRINELIRLYDCSLVVLDPQPNVSSSQELARSYPGRVFLVWYGETGVHMVRWHDKLKTPEQLRKGSKALRMKWQITAHRFQTIDFCLNEIVDRRFTYPNPDSLIQIVRSQETGRYEAENIFRTRFFPHVSSVIREEVIIDPDTGRSKMQWRYTASDPHSLHALNYANLALERMKRAAIFSL